TVKAPEQLLKLSCIIPTLNRGCILVDTIHQLLGQKARAHEIIVVDQTEIAGSNIRSQMEKWQAEGAIIWLRQAEANASLARNQGALAATGDILVFLDD